MSTKNFEALKSLVPKQIHVRLMRSIRYPRKPGFQSHHTGNKELIEHSSEISRAVWRLLPIESNSQDEYTRRAQGEIHLDPQLQPSCSAQFFSVSVSTSQCHVCVISCSHHFHLVHCWTSSVRIRARKRANWFSSFTWSLNCDTTRERAEARCVNLLQFVACFEHLCWLED